MSTKHTATFFRFLNPNTLTGATVNVYCHVDPLATQPKCISYSLSTAAFSVSIDRAQVRDIFRHCRELSPETNITRETYVS